MEEKTLGIGKYHCNHCGNLVDMFKDEVAYILPQTTGADYVVCMQCSPAEKE